MKRTGFALACLWVFAALAAGRSSWAVIPEPTMASVAPSDEETALVQEGVALHEKGQLVAAAEKYRQALEINPQNVQALYELALTLDRQQEHEKAIETARRGCLYWSPLRGALYMVIGSCLDDLGRKEEALEYLEEAGKLLPDDYMVQYNLALTLRNSGKPDEAAKCLKRGIVANPAHGSSHMLLGSIWLDQGFRIPALLAFSRFLVIEPEGPRAKLVAPALLQILRGWSRVEDKDGGKNRTIYVEAKDPHPEEGDFSTVLMTLSLWQGISQAVPKEKRPAELEGTVLALTAAFRALGDEKTTSQSTFACRVYAPYFAEAGEKGHAEALSYYLLRSSGLKGADAWLTKKENASKVKAFLDWSGNYGGPKGATAAPKAAPATK